MDDPRHFRADRIGPLDKRLHAFGGRPGDAEVPLVGQGPMATTVAFHDRLPLEDLGRGTSRSIAHERARRDALSG